MNANHYILSLTGNSYFKVQLPDSSFAYCLSRNFEVNSNGLLVTEQNYPLYEEIQLQDPYTNTLKFSEAGLVSEFISPNWSVIGQVTATLFISPHKLTNLGNGYFAANFQSGEPQTANPGSAGPFENIKLYSRSVIDVPLFYPHVVIKVPVNNYRDILALAHTIISMMTISIAIFDSPDPALSVIQTQADLLETLIADVEGGDHSKIGLRNEAAVNLYLLLQKEIIYVNQVGNGDSGILALSGFSIIDPPDPRPIPEQVIIKRIETYSMQDSIKIFIEKMSQISLNFRVQATLTPNDENSWKDVLRTSNSRELIITKRIHGQEVWYRINAGNPAGTGLWSNPVSFIYSH